MSLHGQSPYATYIEGYKRYLGKAEKERKALIRRARRDLARVVKELARHCGITRAYLFGSLSNGTFDRASDIDLAVEGLRPEDYFSCLGRIEKLTNFRVDLVLLEEAAESLRRRVRDEGVILFDREEPESGKTDQAPLGDR